MKDLEARDREPEEEDPVRRFNLIRRNDPTEISGTGVVVEGVEFSDGFAAIHWLSEYGSWTLWRSTAEMMTVHGHDGATELVWLDPRQGVPS